MSSSVRKRTKCVGRPMAPFRDRSGAPSGSRGRRMVGRPTRMPSAHHRGPGAIFSHLNLRFLAWNLGGFEKAQRRLASQAFLGEQMVVIALTGPRLKDWGIFKDLADSGGRTFQLHLRNHRNIRWRNRASSVARGCGGVSFAG